MIVFWPRKSTLANLCSDCSPFLNWSDDPLEFVHEKTVVFKSLVAALKIQPSLDVSLEAKAVKFLESVRPEGRNSADAFLGTLASNSGDSSPNFVQSIVVLISSASQAIATASIKLLDSLFDWCSAKFNLTLVKADLIPQLINTLNPLSLSFAKAADIHICLMKIITNSLCLATLGDLTALDIEGCDEQQAVHETVLKQVVAPSEKYLCYLCVNRFSVINGTQDEYFMA
ncbi:hypothetical protein BLNAU_14563 [Blattamonas nauphoetae]|uniref:Uncharacterized protein n=1 Tax=Blattamonas nauphoetae TaxID=2049346 RepID=A0ABQ9XGV1_9EUKA|nr:hypothetical protein BLNAU_14563 [Blattamonas nauphoetae]